MTNAETIGRVVPLGEELTASEVDAIVEIAYLTIAVDRRLEAEEIDAFKSVVERLRGAPVERSALDKLLDDMFARADAARGSEGEQSGYADERLRALAGKMSVPARELAYKVAYAMGLADMESSDEEFELDLQLVDALELTNERTEELAGEVMDVLNPPE
jgi:hypothetical protein